MSRPRKRNGGIYRRNDSEFWWARYRNRDGRVVLESTRTADREEAERFLRGRLDARDDGLLPILLASKTLTFSEWADWFLDNRSKPPFRAQGTHHQNVNSVIMLRPNFGDTKLSEITPEQIEQYLRRRLSEGRRCHTKRGLEHRGTVRPSTVHQEFRVLRRILNVAVNQKRLGSNPCNAVEFPASLSKSTRKPHYMTASEQRLIEKCAPKYLRNAIVIISEMGLRPYKELMPMRKSQVDLENLIVHIPDSKTPNGIGDMPMTRPAWRAFKRQIKASPGSDYLFPALNPKARTPYITTLKASWKSSLRRACVAYFPLYHLRHTFASRLSAGGVADHFVTLMLRQGDSDVFKRYSQAKLNMMREALVKMDRRANEHGGSFVTARAN